MQVFSVQLHATGSVREARQLIDQVRAQGFALVAVLRPVAKLTFCLTGLLAQRETESGTPNVPRESALTLL